MVNFEFDSGSPVPAITPTRGLHTPSFVDRATSSVGSVTEYESMHSGTYRDNVVSGKLLQILTYNIKY